MSSPLLWGGQASLFLQANVTAHTVLGLSDRVQFTAKGFSTQTNDIFQVVKSDNTVLVSVTNSLLNLNNHLISNVATPISAQDAANKTYVDSLANGLNWKETVRSATTTTLPTYTYLAGVITETGVGALPAQDGVTLVANDRLLVKNETSTNQPFNGIYVVTQVGSGILPFILTRSSDANTASELQWATVEVGPDATTQAGFIYRESLDITTIGVDNVAFVLLSIGTAYTFRNGLTLTGTNVDVAPGDNSLTSTTGSLIVKRDPAGTVNVSGSGLTINVDNTTIAITANALNVKTGGITNTQVSATAAIAFSKLAPLTDAHILVGNGSNVATDVAVSGDMTLTDTGALTINNSAVTNAKLANMASMTVKANITGSPAAPTDVTLTANPTNTSVVFRDVNANSSFNQAVQNSNVTATAGGTTTFTVASNYYQTFTGSANQTVALPNATTLGTGFAFLIFNQSTGSLTVQNGAGSTLQVMGPSTTAIFVCTANGSNAGSWSFTYQPTGVVPISLGGTGQTTKTAGFDALQPMTTQGDTIYGGVSGTGTRLAGDTSNTRKFLRTLSVAGTAQPPAWDTLVSGDIPNNAANTTGTASNITASTNSTLTSLTALTSAASLNTVGTITTGVWNGTTIAIANGGTGQTTKTTAFDALQPMTTLGDTIYGGTAGSGTRLAGNTTTTKQLLSQTGNGTVSAAPVWAALVSGDIPNNAANTSGTASNVTGTVAIANGGTGQTTASTAFNALSPLTTKGDILVYSTTNTREPIGADGTVLTADSTQTTGMKWATAGGSSTTQTNVLINGNFDYWVRGTSVTVANTVSTYQADRWYVKNSLGTNGVITYSQVTGTSTGAKFGAKVQITTAPTAAQTNGTEFYQVVENFNTLLLLSQSISGSAQIKALGNVNQIGIAFVTATTEVKPTTLLGTESLVSVNTSTFSLASVLNQAVSTTPTTSGVVGIRIRITGVSTGNTYDLNNGYVVEQGTLAIGSTAMTFNRNAPTIAEEQNSCQRYYEIGKIWGSNYNNGTNDSFMFQPWRTTKRVIPSVTLTNVVSDINVGTPVLTYDPQGGEVNFTSVSAGTTRYYKNYTADSEI